MFQSKSFKLVSNDNIRKGRKTFELNNYRWNKYLIIPGLMGFILVLILSNVKFTNETVTVPMDSSSSNSTYISSLNAIKTSRQYQRTVMPVGTIHSPTVQQTSDMAIESQNSTIIFCGNNQSADIAPIVERVLLNRGDAEFHISPVSSSIACLSIANQYNMQKSLRIIWFLPSQNENSSSTMDIAMWKANHSWQVISPVTLYIDGLRPDTSYVFCVVQEDTNMVSPFNCQSHYLSPDLSANISHKSFEKVLTVFLCVAVGLILFLLGIALVYFLLRWRPNLLIGNKRVVPTNIGSHKVFLFPKTDVDESNGEGCRIPFGDNYLMPLISFTGSLSQEHSRSFRHLRRRTFNENEYNLYCKESRLAIMGLMNEGYPKSRAPSIPFVSPSPKILELSTIHFEEDQRKRTNVRRDDEESNNADYEEII